MESIINRCNLVINELTRFSRDMISLGDSIKDDRIELFEKQIEFDLPLDFKYIINKFNGISLVGTKVLGLGDELKGTSLDKVYKFEHTEASNKMPNYLMPFSPDGRGNHYCLNLVKIRNGICPIIFWQWDYNYKQEEEPEECNNSFVDWISEVMIEWTLEEYNYDGTEKH